MTISVGTQVTAWFYDPSYDPFLSIQERRDLKGTIGSLNPLVPLIP